MKDYLSLKELGRLDHLPPDLQKVAREFLELHDAWDTELEARVWLEDSLEICWGSGEDAGRSVARMVLEMAAKARAAGYAL